MSSEVLSDTAVTEAICSHCHEKKVPEKLLIEPALNNVRYLPGEMLYKSLLYIYA
ncbi:hypothetical protein PsalN5692_00302 [Piscirickettsia salmonis]|nr:hypothetical protein PsalN5692_00302 [Piscirickettsia salmonis]